MKQMLKEISEELGELRKSLKNFLSSLPYVDSKKVAELMQQKEPIMQLHNTPAGLHLIMQSYGDYTLLAKYKRDGSFHEYVVCNGYNAETGTWWHGHYFHHDLNGATEFLKCQNEEYVSRLRLEEIATKVLHICKDDKGLIYEIDQEVDFRPSELEYFGLSESEEDDDDYTPSAENGDYSPSNPWDAPGMSVSDFI